MKKQAHIFVTGKVQGVGFRQFVRAQAKRLDVAGWVMNLPDGRVEAVLQGEEEKLAVLISLCYRGPMLAEVSDITLQWEEITTIYSEFQKRI